MSHLCWMVGCLDTGYSKKIKHEHEMNGIEFPLNHQVYECAICYCGLRIFVKFTVVPST